MKSSYRCNLDCWSGAAIHHEENVHGWGKCIFDIANNKKETGTNILKDGWLLG